MGTDFRRTDLKITSDPRLRAGVRAALEWICERHGLSKSEQLDLASAVEMKCGDEFHEQRACVVSITESDYKIEVSVAAVSPSNGKESNSGENGRMSVFPEEHHRKHSAHSETDAKANGASGAVFVKHFHKNSARS